MKLANHEKKVERNRTKSNDVTLEYQGIQKIKEIEIFSKKVLTNYFFESIMQLHFYIFHN